MERKRLSLCIAFVLLAVFSQCSEARHAIERRASDYDISAENMMNDESSDYGTQNDADGGNDADEDDEVVTGEILTKAENYRLLLGKTVLLECKVSPPEGTVVSWSKDSEKIFIGKMKLKPKMDRFSLMEGSSDLLIRDLELTDTGRYTCEIIQKNPVSVTHVIIVEEPPRIANPETSTMENIEYDENVPRIIRFSASDNGQLMEGSDLLLTCEATGNPRPSLIWSRQRRFGHGTEPLTETNGEFANNSFFMKNVTKEDSGSYYCYALNDAGNATAMLQVNVTGVPHVRVHKPIVNTDYNIKAELTCYEPGEFTYIKWYKDDYAIQSHKEQYHLWNNDTHSILFVTPKKDEDFGTYTCEAINPNGKHRKSVELVQKPVIEHLDVEGPKLTWTVHSHQPIEDVEIHLQPLDGEGERKIFKVPLPEKPSHEYEMIYVFDNDKIQDGTYEATVKVKNSKSWGELIDPAVVRMESRAQPIQTASVFRGLGSGAYTLRPTTSVLTTILMYLLVRML